MVDCAGATVSRTAARARDGERSFECWCTSCLMTDARIARQALACSCFAALAKSERQRD